MKQEPDRTQKQVSIEEWDGNPDLTLNCVINADINVDDNCLLDDVYLTYIYILNQETLETTDMKENEVYDDVREFFERTTKFALNSRY